MIYFNLSCVCYSFDYIIDVMKLVQADKQNVIIWFNCVCFFFFFFFFFFASDVS